jgi:hypothetical protein
MRGLFFKIFIIFWIAQSLIFVISTAFILAHRYPRPNFLLDPAFNNLTANATEGANRFEAGGCAGFTAYAEQRHEELALADGREKNSVRPDSFRRGSGSRIQFCHPGAPGRESHDLECAGGFLKRKELHLYCCCSNSPRARGYCRGWAYHFCPCADIYSSSCSYASEQRHPSAVFDCVLNSEHA